MLKTIDYVKLIQGINKSIYITDKLYTVFRNVYCNAMYNVLDLNTNSRIISYLITVQIIKTKYIFFIYDCSISLTYQILQHWLMYFQIRNVCLCCRVWLEFPLQRYPSMSKLKLCSSDQGKQMCACSLLLPHPLTKYILFLKYCTY